MPETPSSIIPPSIGRLAIQNPTTGTATEMTLHQWVDTLPKGHRARRDLTALENRLQSAEVRTSVLGFVLGLILIAAILFLLWR